MDIVYAGIGIFLLFLFFCSLRPQRMQEYMKPTHIPTNRKIKTGFEPTGYLKFGRDYSSKNIKGKLK